MSRPRASIARTGLTGVPRQDPYRIRWSALALARRRSLLVARQEFQAAQLRGDEPELEAWRQLVTSLTEAELERLARDR